MGRQDVGFLHVRTGDDDGKGLVGEDFTVARVKRRMLRSRTSAASTRAATPGAGGRRRPPDGRRRLPPGHVAVPRQPEPERHRLVSSTRGAPGVGERTRRAYGVAVDYPNDRWNAQLQHAARCSANFDPAVGFVRGATTGATTSRRLRPAPAEQPLVRRYQFQRGPRDPHRPPQPDCSSAPSTRRRSASQFQSQDYVRRRRGPHTTSGSTRPSPISPGHHAAGRARVYSYTRFACSGRRRTAACSR